ncbi:glycosyltransferase family 2 protein [Methylobacterium sp. NEAU 140]|uniref:glycosyltransferase family 2 protein n=1 Tax=Methylobacterium sp. NEAU 140 TaxID=3064945 RepID=UPI00273346D3|nr:glycosyltransferase family 2 protein [Methylobacterium sp. NEAU 140]MDP4023454.1 glycosyltransferase family 2 protein [Methylobacterium sp. NEAU 140]
MTTDRAAPVLISLVVPVLNEEASIAPFLARAEPALAEACRLLGPGARSEIVFVDDGSTDATPAVLLAARMRGRGIEIVTLSRNFGKEAALAAGLRHAAGRAVIPIDIDLQDPPEIIPEMVARWMAGAQVVNGVRRSRASDGLAKKLTAGAFYRIYNRLADRPMPSDVGDFRLLDRAVVEVVNGLAERARFSKGLISWLGFTQDSVPFVREPRGRGTTKWRWWGLWNLALDGITASSTAPLRIWTYLGLAIAGLAFLYGALLVGLTLVSGTPTPGYPSLMTAVLFFGGLNLLSLGVMGEYVGRIASEVRGRPLYVVRGATTALPPSSTEAHDGPDGLRPHGLERGDALVVRRA